MTYSQIIILIRFEVQAVCGVGKVSLPALEELLLKATTHILLPTIWFPTINCLPHNCHGGKRFLFSKTTGEELMVEELSELQDALAVVKEEDNTLELATLMELLMGDLK